MMNYKTGFVTFAFILFTLSIGQVHFMDAIPGEDLEVFVNYRNTGVAELENVKVAVYVPDLNIFEVDRVRDIRRNDNKLKILLVEIPSAAPAGWYPVWTILSNDEERTWEFDWLYVE